MNAPAIVVGSVVLIQHPDAVHFGRQASVYGITMHHGRPQYHLAIAGQHVNSLESWHVQHVDDKRTWAQRNGVAQ